INTIQERGKQVSDNKEIKVVGQHNGRVILELGSGSYQFNTKYSYFMQISQKIIQIWVAGLILLSAASAQPKNALQKWQKGVVKDEFIYDKAAFPSCHSASIAETTEGGLVYTFFGGTRERHPDVEIYVCRYENGEWTAPTSVADGVQEDGSRL